MVVLCLSKKFEQHESRLANVREECVKANELHLAIVAIANKTHSALDTLATQMNKELTKTTVAKAKNIRLQKGK